MPLPLPDETTRWRCTRCGNLTRFDVVQSARTKEFWHFGLDGEVTVEQTEKLSGDVESVACRWCATPGTVEAVPRVDADE